MPPESVRRNSGLEDDKSEPELGWRLGERMEMAEASFGLFGFLVGRGDPEPDDVLRP